MLNSVLLLTASSNDLGLAVFNYVECCQLVDNIAQALNGFSQVSVAFFNGSYQVVITGTQHNLTTYESESLTLYQHSFKTAMHAMHNQKAVVDDLICQCQNKGIQIGIQGGGNSPQVIALNTSISHYKTIFKIAFEGTKYN